MLTDEEYEAWSIACYDTPLGEDYPDAALFVRDEQQRFLDSRIRLLTPAPRTSTMQWPPQQVSRDEARRVRALAVFVRARPAALFDRAPGERAQRLRRRSRPGPQR